MVEVKASVDGRGFGYVPVDDRPEWYEADTQIVIKRVGDQTSDDIVEKVGDVHARYIEMDGGVASRINASDRFGFRLYDREPGDTVEVEMERFEPEES